VESVLVTGGSGFVGSEVVQQLRRAGKQVTVVCRHALGLGVTEVEADIVNSIALERKLANHSFDCIMHLASLPGDTGNPQEMIEVNVHGCLNLLELARKRQVKRFVMASSISAYEWYPGTKFQPPDYLPVDEKHPCRPKDMYSSSKRMQEILATTYYHQYGLETVVLRLTAVVGPDGRGGGRGWREFAKQLADGKRVQIPHFSEEEVCHYVDLRDAARMFLVAGENSRAAGQIFNCCAPEPTSGTEFVLAVKQLAPTIEVDCGFPWSMAQGDRVYFDMSKAKQLMGFQPAYSLADSVKSIWEWVASGGLAKKGEQGHSYLAGVTESDT
jgi:UDP-glucuronate 4-epimerase